MDALTYIEKTKNQIDRMKAEGKKAFYDFDVVFDDPYASAKSLREFFEGIGMTVELRECRQCSIPKFDVIIMF